MNNEVNHLHTTLNVSNDVKTQYKHKHMDFTPFLLGFAVGFICFYLIYKYGRENY